MNALLHRAESKKARDLSVASLTILRTKLRPNSSYHIRVFLPLQALNNVPAPKYRYQQIFRLLAYINNLLHRLSG